MSKKLLVFLISGTIVIIFIATFLILKKSNRFKEEPLKAVPPDVGILIKVNDFSNLIKYFYSNNLWKDLREVPVFTNVDNQIKYLDSLISTNSNARSLLLNNPSYISVNPVGKGKAEFIHIFRVSGNLNEKEINQTIKDLIAGEGELTSRKYEGNNIYDVIFPANNRVGAFSFSITKGLFILSYSPILVEDAIRQLAQPLSILNDPEFVKSFNTSGKNVPANVFINYKQFPKLVSLQVNNNYKPVVRRYNYFASWAELDMNIKQDILLLNGFTAISDSVPQLFSLFRNQSPKKFTVDNVLPSTVSAFLSISLSDIKSYIENYAQFLSDKGEINSFQQKISSLKLNYGIDLNQSFINLLDEEFAIALEKVKDNGKADYYAVFKIKSKSQTERTLEEVLEKVAERNSVLVETYHTKAKIDNELSYPVYRLDIKNFLSDYLGSFFGCITENYFTIIDGFLVFGNSVESLSSFLKANVLRGTLITEPNFREFKDNLAPRSTVCFYADLSRAPYVFSEFLSPHFFTEWENNIKVFQKVQVFGLQLNGGNDMMYTSAFLKSVSEYKDKPHTVWESLLDTSFILKPQFLVNHNSNEPEIFLQDLHNTIYLINQAGRILWKQNLSEKINSTIYQIDYYSNGKLQILFSTDNYIHLLDRNGNYIERYPVKLRATATNGLSLIDYDNNKNYRIFIACEDKNVYAYNKDGSLLDGWTFSGTEGNVRQPVNLFQNGGKDYIVFGDELNTYVLNRKGEKRFDVKELIPRSKNNNYHFNSEVSSNIITTDTLGNIIRIFLDGRTEKSSLGTYSSEHFFDFKDIDGNGDKDYIFLDENSLSVFKTDGTLIYDYTSNDPVDLPPVFYIFSSTDRKIGLVSQKAGEIYLINNDGSLYTGFPLVGKTLFSIGHFDSNGPRFNLIVGGEENFLYNYIVQ